jgi:protocatechuate 3,4-dioxygenase beta subunit
MIPNSSMNEPDDNIEDPQDSAEDEQVEPRGAELLIEYLQSEQGHKIADRLVTLFENKQKQAIQKGYKFQTRVLFAQLGYLNTNQNGLFEFRTIRPAGYPNSNLPAHIHVEVAVPGDEPHTFISEILFADDSRLTSDVRERSLREGLVIFGLTRATNGEWRLQADFQIR